MTIFSEIVFLPFLCIYIFSDLSLYVKKVLGKSKNDNFYITIRRNFLPKNGKARNNGYLRLFT